MTLLTTYFLLDLVVSSTNVNHPSTDNPSQLAGARPCHKESLEHDKTRSRTALGQLCAILWGSRSQSVVTQPGIEHQTVLSLCSAIDRCTTQDPDLLHIGLEWLSLLFTKISFLFGSE